MAITSGDFVFRLSVKTGSAGDSTAGTPAGSLGKYVSTTAITDATLNNLFDDVSGDENAASDVEYRCFFILNNHATLTLQNAVVWLQSETGGGASIAIAVDGVGATIKTSASAQADEVADESTAPTGESFSSPASKGAGLSLGNIQAGYVHAIWVRRTAADTAALDNDGVVLRIEGDTAA